MGPGLIFCPPSLFQSKSSVFDCIQLQKPSSNEQVKSPTVKMNEKKVITNIRYVFDGYALKDKFSPVKVQCKRSF